MKRLEVTAYICMILVCIVSLALLIENRVKKSYGPPTSAAPSVGTRLDVPAPWSRAKTNIVVVMTSTCKYCRASVPLYKTVSDLVASQPREKSFYVVSPEDPKTIGEFLSQYGIRPQHVYQATFEKLGIQYTPTVYIVDAKGSVTKSVVGLMVGDVEDDFLKAVTHGLEPTHKISEATPAGRDGG
jgi:hypothetical protein